MAKGEVFDARTNHLVLNDLQLSFFSKTDDKIFKE
jgi:hypothetical protein